MILSLVSLERPLLCRCAEESSSVFKTLQTLKFRALEGKMNFLRFANHFMVIANRAVH